jgi:hypothetical protein
MRDEVSPPIPGSIRADWLNERATAKTDRPRMTESTFWRRSLPSFVLAHMSEDLVLSARAFGCSSSETNTSRLRIPPAAGPNGEEEPWNE